VRGLASMFVSPGVQRVVMHLAVEIYAQILTNKVVSIEI